MLAIPFIATPLAGIERIDVDIDNLCKYDREVLGYKDVYRNSWGRIIVKDGIDTKLSGTLMNLFDYNPYWMDEYYCDLTEEQKPYFRKAVIETSNVLTEDNAKSIEEEESFVTSKDMTKKNGESIEEAVSTDTSNLLTEEKNKASFYSVFNNY